MLVARSRNGRVVEEGVTAKIFNDPRDNYTKRLLAATPHLHSRLVDLLPPADRRPFLAPVAATSASASSACREREVVLKVDLLVREYGLGPTRRRMFEKLRSARGVETPDPGMLRAVDGISFHIGAGECVGLVGESGCGKTTTSRLIAKLIKPTAGSIQLGEEIGADDPRTFARSHKRKLIQMVFQDPFSSLDPQRTAFEAIADPLMRLEGVKRSTELRDRIEIICDLVGLSTDLLDRYPHQLSGGQKARVGIARVIAVKPALVVLDEPTSALDVSVQAVVPNQLSKLKRELGLSYLFVTHDLNVVRLLCDRVLVMKSGKIVEQGSTEALFEAPTRIYQTIAGCHTNHPI
jgi:peptide/nickel transport system ATP-binding protein